MSQLIDSGTLLGSPTASRLSRIEGTQASVTDIFEAAVTGETARDDIREVSNYIKAMEHGIERLDDGLPLSMA